jgi:predicted dehydrogenase
MYCSGVIQGLTTRSVSYPARNSGDAVPKPVIRVGIVGTGLIAREHAQAISMVRNNPGLVAAADIDSGRLEEFCASFQVPWRYQGAEDLIADPEVDLVVITTPPAAHEELVVAALEKGKYVFCEKPLAHSLASAVRIAEAEARHPGRLTVSYQLRYDPSFRRLIWLCRNGWMGKTHSALIERHSYVPYANHGSGDWWGTWKVAGGGVLLTQLIHELDLLLLVMGRPLSVTASMDTRHTDIESEDYVEATFRFESGATARCVSSVNSGRTGGGFTVRGSNGTVGLPWHINLTDPSLIPKALAALDKALPDTRLPSSSLISRGVRFAGRRLGANAKPTLTPHALLYQEIAHNMKLGKPLPIPAADAMGSLELCFAAYESALTGEEVSLPLHPASLVYGGVLKKDYDARKCSWEKTKPKERRVVKTNGNRNLVRVGLVGLDTSHATSFASILQDPDNPFHIPGARVAAAYPGGSHDMPISISRVAGFTNKLKHKYGVPIMDAPEDVAEACDLVCILASDGRAHPALVRAVAGRCRSVFVDKPFAVSTEDAQRMLMQSEKTGTRIFTTSAFRYADGLVDALISIRSTGERIKSCRVRYWLQLQETQGRYFWYGIHGAEMLLAIMGKGIRSVEVSEQGNRDTINVWHQDGRQSSLIGSKDDGTFHVSIETDVRTLEVNLGPSNPSLAARVVAAALDVLTDGNFPRLWSATAAGSVSGNRSGRAFDPDQEETLEVIGLLEAAQRGFSSKERTAIREIQAPLSL